jgi:hypothetical protein
MFFKRLVTLALAMFLFWAAGGLAWAEIDISIVELVPASKCPPVSVDFPQINIPEIDRPVGKWAEKEFASAVGHFKGYDNIEELCRNQEKAKNEDPDYDDEGDHKINIFLYNFSATVGTVSYMFFTYAYTGGAHQSFLLDSLVFNLKGEPLKLNDLFDNPKGLLEFLSQFCFEDLKHQNREFENWQYKEEGLEPTEENFALFLITPNGLTIQFQSYQLGGFGYMPTCDIPLSRLEKFKPKDSIWATNLKAPGCENPADVYEKALCQNPILVEQERTQAARLEKQGAVRENKSLRPALDDDCLANIEMCMFYQFAKNAETMKGVTTK